MGLVSAHVEIAATEPARRLGLMHRKSLLQDHGMLFVFDHPDIHCFWMKNTPLPLSIAFIDATGRIVNITDMQPFNEASHCPPAPIVYALEMQQGWFAANNISSGMQVDGLPAGNSK